MIYTNQGGKGMATELNQKLERLGKNIAARESAKVYQFPLWGDPQRGVPNEFARSALFAARKGTDGIYCERVPLFSQGNFTINYSGPRLTQDHLDVFEGIMHLAREMPEGNVVRFKTKSLLKLIGRSTGKRDRDVTVCYGLCYISQLQLWRLRAKIQVFIAALYFLNGGRGRRIQAILLFVLTVTLSNCLSVVLP